MCGRYVLGDSTWAAYHDALSIIRPDPAVISYNIKPTQTVAMAFQGQNGIQADVARWWFVPHWHKGDVKDWKATTFNARMETAHEKPVFRTAWARQRCIIPATGYFEWTGEKGNKQPWFIGVEQNIPVFFFAGLYSELRDGSKTCTIVTRAADEAIAELHPRMPVILKPDELTLWMQGQNDEDVGMGHRFSFHRVARFGIKDDGPHLIDHDDLF